MMTRWQISGVRSAVQLPCIVLLALQLCCSTVRRVCSSIMAIEAPWSAATRTSVTDPNMANYIGGKFGQADHEKLADYQERMDPNDKQAQSLLEEMRAHIKKLEEMRKNEDPRLSFSTPEFKEAQRMFSDGFKKNFGKPVEWGMVKDYPWSAPQLRKLDTPVDVNGKPWPEQEQPKTKV